MHKTYKTTGTCSKQIDFDVEDNKVYNVKFLGGCNGNLQGIAALVEGQDINTVIEKVKGIKCGFKETSCPDQLAKALEEARAAKVIGKSFNAKLTITLDSKAKEVFAPLFESAAQILIVSQIEFVDADEFKVVVNAASGALCSRCWMIVPHINEDELCPRCAKIVAGIKNE